MTWTYKDILDALEDDDSRVAELIANDKISRHVLLRALEAREGILVETYQGGRARGLFGPQEAAESARELFQSDASWCRIKKVLEARFPTRGSGRPSPVAGTRGSYKVQQMRHRREPFVMLPVLSLGSEKGTYVAAAFGEDQIVVRRVECSTNDSNSAEPE